MASSRPPSRMRVIWLGTLHHRPAVPARALCLAGEEAVKHGRELLLDVGEHEELLVQLLTAALAVPLEPILFPGTPDPFDDQPDRACGALRGVRYSGGQQQDL